MRAMGDPSGNKMPITVTGLATGALALSAALAWNDAVKTAVKEGVPYSCGGAARSMFIYALLVTLIIIVVAWALNRTQVAYNQFRARRSGGQLPQAGPVNSPRPGPPRSGQ